MKPTSFFFLFVLNMALAIATIVVVIAGWRSFKLAFQGEKTSGLVVNMVETTDSEGYCCVYSPVVRYTIGERTLEVEGKTASFPPAYSVGDEVEVVYDPENHTNAALNKFSELWILPTIMGLVVAVLFVSLNFVAISALVVSGRKQ